MCLYQASLLTVLTKNGDTWGETGTNKRRLGQINYNFVEGDDTSCVRALYLGVPGSNLT